MKRSSQKKSKINSKPAQELYSKYETLIQQFIAFTAPLNESDLSAVQKDIQKTIRKQAPIQTYQNYERPFVFKIAYQSIIDRFHSAPTPTYSNKEIQLDTEGSVQEKLNQFYFYFNRLSLEQKALLIFKYQFEFKLSEIASIMNASEGAIQLKIDFAIHALEDWIFQGQRTSQSKTKVISTIQQPMESTLRQTKQPSESDSKSRWKRTPWFLRSGAESLMFAVAILLVVIMIPKMKSFYEKSLEKRLDSFDLADLNATQDEMAVLKANLLKNTVFGRPECENTYEKLPKIGCKKNGSAIYAKTASENDELKFVFSSDEIITASDSRTLASLPNEEEDAEEIRVGQSEIWRFNIRTDSPEDLREMVKEYLDSLGQDRTLAGSDGIKAPGGIQFNLLLPREYVSELKNKMHLFAKSYVGDPNSTVSDTFTWYKIKSRKRIPSGKTRVVIWLSQI